jgi:eukaryotic-like serine/threonine-protein kinase
VAPDAHTSRLSAGRRLGGRYEILRHLASGGMAEVHLARTLGVGGFERYVVVKTILPERAKDPAFVAMFLDEARLSAQLHHQNIAQVFDVGEDGGALYFAMEYVHGENLLAVLQAATAARRQVPTEHALAIIVGAAAGLDYAHAKVGPDREPLGLIHRDVSPSNLIVAYDGTVKVVDFGVAKASTRATRTRSGTVKGKLAYMSPEQCRALEIDRRSDVFSLGTVLYELTTLSRLFDYPSDYDTMNALVSGVVQPPSERRPDYPVDLEPIVMRCLAKDPADRWQSAGALLEAVEDLARTHGLVLSPRALGRYMTELFGERPEPWLDPDRIETTIRPSPNAVPVTVATIESVASPDAAAVAQAPVSVSAASAAVDAPRRRRWPIAVGVAAIAGAGIAAMLALADVGGAVPSAPAAAPTPAETPTPGLPPTPDLRSTTDPLVTTPPVTDPPVTEPPKTRGEDDAPTTPARRRRESGHRATRAATTTREPEPVTAGSAASPPERDPQTLLPPSKKTR